MTTYAFPSITPINSTWRLISNTAMFGDPLKGNVQVLARPGAKWAATVTFPVLTDSDRLAMQVFLVKLRGRENRFTMHNHGAQLQGTGAGTPLVNGASQTGTQLVTDGWGTTQTVLKAGDFFGVNGELKQCTADVTSDGSGNATINFEPALRASPANDAAIDVSSPTATFMLETDDVGWSNTSGSASRIFSGFTIDCIEVF
jgi:hypothetical protein